MGFCNAYDDSAYAAAYVELDFSGTYLLAFRDLPRIFSEHVRGSVALDFGCGAGRSTRFLRRYGFDAVGVDISADMIRQALEIDPAGDYRLIPEADLDQFHSGSFDLVFSAFTFDNIPTRERKEKNLRALARLLHQGGRIVNLVSSEDMYTNEWVSFSTRDFPDNRKAKNGDVVKIIITAIPDSRPVDDVFWMEQAYRELFWETSLELIQFHQPLARGDEPFKWINETRIAPWSIHVLASRVTSF